MYPVRPFACTSLPRPVPTVHRTVESARVPVVPDWRERGTPHPLRGGVTHHRRLAETGRQNPSADEDAGRASAPDGAAPYTQVRGDRIRQTVGSQKIAEMQWYCNRIEVKSGFRGNYLTGSRENCTVFALLYWSYRVMITAENSLDTRALIRKIALVSARKEDVHVPKTLLCSGRASPLWG